MQNTQRLTLLVATLGVLAAADVARFDNYKVYRIAVENGAQASALLDLQRSSRGYDFWSDVRPMGPNARAAHLVDLMVPPHLGAEFKELVDDHGLKYTVFIENVQRLIDQENQTQRNKAPKFDFANYHRYDDILDYLDELAATHPVVKVVTGGKTYEGRQIKGVKVSFKAGNRGIFIEAGIHAREWISPATVLYILDQLLNSNDARVRSMAEKYDWYIFPSTNPDGYEHTHTSDRLWRKTRTPYGSCRGADPNRNWGYHWMDGGASSIPCTETYAGPSAFSEIETKSLSEYITSVQSNLLAYLGFHSYSQLMLIPYGYTAEHLDNYDDLLEIGLLSADALAKRYGTEYVVGNIVEAIYVASGGSMDWVKGLYKTNITYTYELRDKGRYGFLLPPNQIVPTGEETLDSLVTMMEEAEKRGYK